MLKDHIARLIISKLGETPTPGQNNLISSIADFIVHSESRDVFLIKGYAGTGKTKVISAVVNALADLKVKSVLLAPTGRAAKVLSTFSGIPASTIHKKIYKQKSSKDGFGKFVLGKNLSGSTFFIVDEASMIGNQMQEANLFGSGNLLGDLIEYVYNEKNCKLILIGDTAQLPPVSVSLSPALDHRVLEENKLTVKVQILTDVVRQTNFSGILSNATIIRKSITENKINIPKFRTDGFQDIRKISGTELIPELTEAFEKYGIEETVIICRSNKRANMYNNGIRNSILFREERLSKDDYLMVVKNNYFWLSGEENVDFIANGDIMQVVKIKGYQERYGFHFADVVLRMIDNEDKEITAKIILETIDIESASLGAEENKKLFYNIYEDFKHLTPKQKGYNMVKNDPYFNALQVKFSYALTCHKAQGGQWKAIFVDQGFFKKEMLDIEYLRWLYTACTRATEVLYLVNFNEEFF